MNHRKPLASLTARSAAIIGALAAYMIPPLTGVCKNEIIATNRPCHLWIPAYAGMMEWA